MSGTFGPPPHRLAAPFKKFKAGPPDVGAFALPPPAVACLPVLVLCFVAIGFVAPSLDAAASPLKKRAAADLTFTGHANLSSVASFTGLYSETFQCSRLTCSTIAGRSSWSPGVLALKIATSSARSGGATVRT